MNNIAKDVPVIVDAIKNLDHDITRCVYFTIDAVLPESEGLVTIEDVNIPFLISGEIQGTGNIGDVLNIYSLQR